MTERKKERVDRQIRKQMKLNPRKERGISGLEEGNRLNPAAESKRKESNSR